MSNTNVNKSASLAPRNRVIYQSEALFISPDTTGNHLYYMPPSAVKNAGAQSECMVTGTDENGSQVVFDACMGTGIDASGIARDFKFNTFSCTGHDQIASSTSGVHPVLWDAGMRTNIAGGGLTYLDYSADRTSGSFGTTLEQLKRVQSANYSFTINRQDINQFGHLARLDSVVLEAPTVSMDFSYYLTDGENERLMGMVTDASFQHLSGMMTRSQNEFGNSYFILTVPEGRDALKGDQQVKDENKTVIGVGNAYVTDYSIEASVGSFPTASVTVEAMNIKSDIGADYNTIPAIDPQDGSLLCNKCFYLPPVESGQGQSVLKPGDITIDLQDAGLISRQLSGNTVGYNLPEDKGSAHIQSFTLSTPMGRTALQRLGSTYAYAKEIDFPVTCTLTVNALVADLKSGNLVDLVCGGTYDLKVRMQNPQCVVCEPNSAADAIVVDFRKAVLDSESFSSAIGDNKTVDLTFSTQVGGPEEALVGVFFSGFENKTGADGLHKSFPEIADTGDGKLKFFRYGAEGTTGYYNGSHLSGWNNEVFAHTKKF
jgi:hypothetical protein